MNRVLLVISLVVFAFIAVNCGADDPPPPPPDRPPADATTPPDRESPEEKFFKEKCGTCHQLDQFPGWVETLSLNEFKDVLTDAIHASIELTEAEKSAITAKFEELKQKEAVKEPVAEPDEEVEEEEEEYSY